MKITRQADYATRAVVHLARAPQDKLVATGEIAKGQNIPASFLAKIIAQLSVAGLVHTSRGARGGVRLARDPGDVTLLEVLEAIDGPIQLNICVEQREKCTFEKNCPLQPVWCDAQAELVSRLRNTNFGQMVETDKALP
jgi:Rrf2 family protein